MMGNTATVSIRPWRTGDEEALVVHANDGGLWPNLTPGAVPPYTLNDARAWVATADTHTDDGRHFAIALNGQAIGAAGFDRLPDVGCRAAEIGYWVGRAYWGRGVATTALRLTTNFAFAHYDFSRLEADILASNVGSRRVAEKAGYHRETRLHRSARANEHLDELVSYVCLRADHLPGGAADAYSAP